MYDTIPPSESEASPAPGQQPVQASLSWWQTMIMAVTQPREATFQRIAFDANASAGRGYLWVFLSSLFSALVLIPASFILNPMFVRALSDLGSRNQGQALLVVTGLMICLVPFSGLIAAIGLAIQAALIQICARIFSGQGEYSRLVYAMAAYYAPLGVVSAAINLIPFLGGCISIFLSIYLLVLTVLATKAVNRFETTGAAVAAVLLPAVVFIILICCITVGILALLGPAIGDTFQQLAPQFQQLP
jgi:hypothetical protein